MAQDATKQLETYIAEMRREAYEQGVADTKRRMHEAIEALSNAISATANKVFASKVERQEPKEGSSKERHPKGLGDRLASETVGQMEGSFSAGDLRGSILELHDTDIPASSLHRSIEKLVKRGVLEKTEPGRWRRKAPPAMGAVAMGLATVVRKAAG